MEIVERLEQARSLNRGTVGFVATLGFVHEGHLSLIERAAKENDHVVVSLYLNPLQFAEGEDFQTYPRDPIRDAALISDAGADVLLAPDEKEMFPEPAAVRVTVERLGDVLEGASRPGHFAGVATIVTKFLSALAPHRAYFGRKDAQQLAVVSKLVTDLSFPVEVVGCPTVRESDGLALSSRNTYLTTQERRRALALHRGLMAASDRIESGERASASLVESVRASADGFEFEYVSLVDRRTLETINILDRPSFLAVAGMVGDTRLIDNVHIDMAASGQARVDRGVRLDRPSVLYGDG